MERNNKGQFVKGMKPWNEGLKGVNGDPRNETSYKSGKQHPKYKPIGSERVDSKDGYVVVKVAERKWRPKHHHIWEQENGKIPKGYVVLFGNGNKRDFRIENLILVHRKNLAVMNKNHLIMNDEELTKTGVAISDLMMKTNERRKCEWI